MSSTQCAAVKMYCLLIIEPPQTRPSTSKIAAANGNSWFLAFSPPITLW